MNNDNQEEVYFCFEKALKFPLKLLFRRKREKGTELEEKCWKHVRNFASGRLKNISWQRSLGKNKRKRKNKGKFSRKKTNNFSKNRNY